MRRGHPWVFSNEVDIERSPLTGFGAGDCVNVLSHAGRPMGSAYVNPHSLICARIYSGHSDRALDETLIAPRLGDALALRDALGWSPWCRLVHGEGDRLRGLVVDRYGDVLAVQIGNGQEFHVSRPGGQAPVRPPEYDTSGCLQRSWRQSTL